MSSTEEEREVRRTSPFADEVVEERTLEIDEGGVERSVSLDPPFVLISYLLRLPFIPRRFPFLTSICENGVEEFSIEFILQRWQNWES